MRSAEFIIRTFRLLADHQPWKLLLIFLLTLLLGVNSGFSIMLLIPLLQLLNVGGGEPAEGVALFFRNLAGKTGINLSIETVLITYVVILTINAFLQHWKSVLDAGYQQSFIYRLRRRLFRKIILADWPLLNNKSKTNHLQVLSKEVSNLASYYYFYLRLITTLIMAAAYIAYAMLVSATFTLIILALGMALFISLRKFLFKAFDLGRGYVDSYSQLLKYIDDFWQTVKIAKVHSSEAFYYRKFDEASTSLVDLEYRMQRNHSLPQLIYRVAGILTLVFIVYVGYKTGQVQLASFFILILLFSRIFPQFVAINTDLNMILSNVASVQLVMQLDGEFPDAAFHEPARVNPLPLENEVRLDKVCFSYPGGERLFENFSAVIPARKMTGVLGESGIGKTTLIDLIAGLQKPDSGLIYVDGNELDDESLPLWKSGIGYLPQDPFFVDGTMRENLVWDSSNGISDNMILETLERVNALHLASRYERGLDHHIVNYPFCFSGGECQRLALARVLLRNPRLLLLDEATSSLDGDNETAIMEVLSRLKEKVTIVFVTHRVNMTQFFDHIIKL